MSNQEEKTSFTSLDELGEFGLIDKLTEGLKFNNSTTKVGVGDDAAVIDHDGCRTLVSTDLLVEGIHFDMVYTPLKHLGNKSAVVNFSDIYAMNGTPTQIVIGLAVSNRYSVEALEEFYSGLRLACENYGVDLVGGDTTSSKSGMMISITVIGKAKEEDIVYRSGAKPNDLLCVSGDLGGAYMGLLILEREKSEYLANPNMQPQLKGLDYILQRQLRPEARKDIVEIFHDEGIKPTSMIDISDGLASEILHICKESNTGCRLFEKEIPIDYQTAVMAEEMNMNLTTCALNGGEDYELLFTCSIGDYEKVKSLEGIRVIGHITKPELGCQLVTRDGQEFELKAQGWNHCE